MEQYTAQKISSELKIDITQVVREYYEILILKGLFDSPYGKYLIFKGGTALRLVYGSPRFSEDIDFSITRDALKGKFSSLIKGIVSQYPEAAISDLAEKFYTYLAEIKISQSYLPSPFRVKIEISKRIKKNYNSELRLITSAASPLQVLGRAAALEQIYKDKLDCLKGRTTAKDIFDIWFICQKLKIPYTPPETPIPKKILRRDLRKYLPANYWNIIEEL